MKESSHTYIFLLQGAMDTKATLLFCYSNYRRAMNIGSLFFTNDFMRKISIQCDAFQFGNTLTIR